MRLTPDERTSQLPPSQERLGHSLSSRDEEYQSSHEHRYQLLFESVNDAIFLRPLGSRRRPGNFVEVNRVGCEWLGYSQEELQQRSPIDIDPKLTPERLITREEEIRREGSVVFQTSFRTKSGKELPVEISTRLVNMEGQQMLLSIARNLSQRLEAEAVLRESERRFQEVVQEVGLVSVMLDQAGSVIFANRSFLQLTGMEVDGALGCNWFEVFVGPEDTARAQQAFKTVLEGQPFPRCLFHIVNRRGERRLVAWNHTGVKDLSGRIIGVASIGEDVTERTAAEERLRKSEENYRTVFMHAPIGIFQSTTSRILSVNPTLARIFGYESPTEMLESVSNPARLFVHPDQRKRVIQRALETQGYTEQEVEYRTKDERIIVAKLWARVVRDRSGELRFFEGFVEDITTRKQLQDQVRMREEHLNSFFNNATAGLCTLGPDLRYLTINQKLAQINGVPPELHLGRSISEVLPKFAPVIEPLVRRVFETGQPVCNVEVSGEISASNGALHHALVSYFPLFAEDGRVNAAGAVVVDITQLKRAEARLRESEERFRQLAENVDKVFWISSMESGEILYVSPMYEKVWGRTCQSLYECRSSFLEAIHKDDRRRVVAAIQRQKLGSDYEQEYRVVRPDGSVRWVRDRRFVVMDAHGEVYRVAGLAEDITERRDLAEQLRQAQKMEAIGELAGGVAHDFNNILAAILIQLGLLEQNPELPTGLRGMVKDVETEATRAGTLTRQLLLFSRRQAARIEPLELNCLLQDLLKMLVRLLGERVKIEFKPCRNPLHVEADASMLEQVVLNLCINARDAMTEGGQLTLLTRIEVRESRSANAQPDGHMGRFVCLEVADTGCGMDESVLKRIFEPFFTTKERGKGTGLGLATVYGIVKQHRGWIEVQSKPGQGSSFRVYLPARKPSTESPPKASRREAIAGGSETILLVEDDPALRQATAVCLRILGYAVLEASNGAEALTRWNERLKSVELLLTDFMMPGTMTGLDLAKELKNTAPNLRVLLMTGYSADLAKPNHHPKDFSVLAKPFTTAALAGAVRQILDRA